MSAYSAVSKNLTGPFVFETHPFCSVVMFWQSGTIVDKDIDVLLSVPEIYTSLLRFFADYIIRNIYKKQKSDMKVDFKACN